jgi:hypothetical protein
MNSLNIDTLYAPLYMSGLVSSAFLLGLIRQQDSAAEKQELTQRFDPDRRIYVRQRTMRVRIGVAPLLSFGRPNTARLLSPTFLLTEVLPREAMSIIPFTISWLLLLAGEPTWWGITAAFGLAWRAVVDGNSLPDSWSKDERIQTVALKSTWCLLSGVWLGSIVAFWWAVALAAILVLAMCAAGASKSRRDK